MTIDVRHVQTYADLLVAVQQRPIRGDEEATVISDLIDILTDLPELSEGQREFIGLLGQLQYDWETEHEEPIDVSPQEIVHSLLEDNGLRQANLVGPVFSSAPAVSNFLAGRRPLSYERVGKLAPFFHVSPAVFYPARGTMLEATHKRGGQG
ncbi:MAG: helix-turn-helix domain-containing protein [Dehalococcoidia bacterium]